MLDLLQLTAYEAQRLLQDGKTTSVKLVEAYLDQIERHNHNGLRLHALISVAPRETLLKAARQLDTERKASKLRGPLHGIPIVVKDVFTTRGYGIPTTGGAPCFAEAKAKRTAPLIEHLTASGLILIGTANLTEFCGLKDDRITPGWSPMGGQTQSPYIFGGLETDEKIIGHSAIGGSSAGSAAAVAAGFSPLSVGTECCGSLITPANRGALYALKCGLDEVDVEGCFHFSDCIDFIGGMAKSSDDLAMLTAALMKRQTPVDITGGLEGLRVGFCDVKEWRLSDAMSNWPGDTREQMENSYADAIATIRRHGATVVENIELPSGPGVFNIDGKSLFQEIAFYQLRKKQMQAFIDEFDESPVSSLEDMIKFNEEHADQCLPPEQPGQSQLHALVANRFTEEKCQAMLAELRKRGHAGLGKAFEQVQIVVALTDSSLCMYTTAIGGPIACMPLGTVKYSEENERPFGLCAAAPRGGEELLLRFMAGCEAVFPARPLPKPLLETGQC